MKPRHIILSTLCAVVAATVFCGCNDCIYVPGPGGPADVVLAISSPATKALAEEDYYRINSVKIFAFAHDHDTGNPGNLVGYTALDGLDWSIDTGSQGGPYYFEMHLKETGNFDLVDFVVLLNSEAAALTSADVTIGEGLPYSTLSGLYFSGINEEANASGSAVPMSNEKTGDTPDANNFTFTVQSDQTTPQIILVEVKRAVGRLTVNLAAQGDVTVTALTLHQGPTSAPLILSGGNVPTAYNAAQTQTQTLIDAGSPVTLNQGTAVDDSNMKNFRIADTYLLPNPDYGTESKDGTASFSVQDAPTAKSRSYYLDITYRLGTDPDTEPITKQIYLPPVPANTQINVNGTIKDEVEAGFEIIASAWTEKEMTIEFD